MEVMYMGKAAQCRKARRMSYLVKLSYDDPSRFEAEWEIGVWSWLYEIRDAAREWAVGGEGSKARVFEIMEEAADILKKCEKSIYKKHAPDVYGLIWNDSCLQVSRVIDSRLYRFSNTDQLAYTVSKNSRV
jgi:hypothetical protein